MNPTLAADSQTAAQTIIMVILILIVAAVALALLCLVGYAFVHALYGLVVNVWNWLFLLVPAALVGLIGTAIFGHPWICIGAGAAFGFVVLMWAAAVDDIS